MTMPNGTESTPTPEASAGSADPVSPGTGPDSSTQVHEPEGGTQSNSEVTLEVPLYSQKTYEAAIENARSESRTSAIQEYDDRQAERRRALVEAVTAKDGDLAPVVRNVKRALQELAGENTLTDDEMEPLIKAVRDSHGIVLGAAGDVAKAAWRAAITGLFSDEKEVQDLFAKARGLDPSVDASTLLPLIIDARALSSEAVRTAEPALLVERNSKLKQYISEREDLARAAGRDQGRLDPVGDPQHVEGQSTRNSAPTSFSLEEAKTLPPAELVRRRQAAASGA